MPSLRSAENGGSKGRSLRIEPAWVSKYVIPYWMFPNVMLNVYLDNTSINIIIPISHDKTLTIFEWYFEAPGTGEGWESMQQIIAFSDEIQQEDIEICEWVQKGLRSKAYDRGRFSVLRENGVHHFQSLVHEFLTRN
ncbi:MAG: hypothetical protein OXG85_10815 [Chloroflexi bacterium]|nr:hypothetical protein [Chloroflexota bacterium]